MNGKIKVKAPIFEMDGDEMIRVLWKIIKDKFLTPYLNISLEYHNLPS